MRRPPKIWFAWDYSLILDWKDGGEFPEPVLPNVESLLPDELNARILQWYDEMEQHYGEAFRDGWTSPSPQIEEALEREYLEIREQMRNLGLSVAREGSRWPFGTSRRVPHLRRLFRGAAGHRVRRG